MNCIPVFSSNSEEGYLNYCKRILWPSFHNVTVLDQCCAAWHERAEWDQQVKLLREAGWVDARTRAVFVSFNLYNPLVTRDCARVRACMFARASTRFHRP